MGLTITPSSTTLTKTSVAPVWALFATSSCRVSSSVFPGRAFLTEIAVILPRKRSGSPSAKGRTRMIRVMFSVFLVAGCGDKAQANYAKCVQLDTTGDSAGAVAACTAAIGDDPNSVSGKAAADKIASIKAKEKTEADARAILQRVATEMAQRFPDLDIRCRS